IAPLLNEKNEISNYIAIKQDISDRVQALEEIQQRTEDLTLINMINMASINGMDFPELMQILSKAVKRVFKNLSVAIYLYNKDQNLLVLQSLNLPPGLLKRVEKLIGSRVPDIQIPVKAEGLAQKFLFETGPHILKSDESIQEWMFELTNTIDLSVKSQHAIRKLIPQLFKLIGIKSLISIPMVVAGEPIGLMEFSRRSPIKEKDLDRVVGIVGQVTAAIAKIRAEKEMARSRNLLLTLSQAAPAVQQANSADEVFRAIGEHVTKLGLDVTVFTLGDDKKHMVVSYLSHETDVIQKIEKLTKLSIINYGFPLKVEGYYHKIITNKETVFHPFNITSIEEILPRVLRPLANKLMNIVDNSQSIVAPLVVDDEVLGLMAFTSSDLSESDIPTITTFANQAAIALEKTRLFHDTEALAAFNESIIQNMSEGIVLEDVEGMITFVNPSAAKMLGYTSEEWVEKHWTEIIPVDQQSIVQDADERRMRGESDRYELELVNKEGQRISVLVGGSPRLDREGQFVGTMAVFTDITERKQAEERISRFSRIFEDSLNEIFLFDPETLKFIQVNAAGQNNLGYTMEELYQLTPLDIKPEITAKSFEYLIAPLRNDETNRVVFETVHKRKDGSLYHVEVHLQLLRYENTSLFAAIILDITDRYQAELENKRYIRRLDALLNIDQAIMGSFDLQVTLDVILEHLSTQLAVDAVAVLSYQADLQALTFTQSRGFQTSALQTAELRLGEGYAGEVGLQREHVFVPDLNLAMGKFKKSPPFSEEDFVSYYGVPLITKGKLVGVLEIYHRSPLDPDDEWVNYLKLLAGQAAIAIDNISLFNELQRTNVNLTLAYDATIEGWAHALELKDMETEGHSRRVVKMTMDLAKSMGISGEKLAHIRRGALLHDIGKMGVPDSILQKPGKLSEGEWEIMRRHPVYAYEWLSRIQYLVPALEIPYSHHERWDGTGYPRGIKGEQIPLEARIFAIIDVW
ncbi:MAG TPA: PAS domain S-box protein, partial [Chloroflexi bacterium]|nr:PAS domain S-box protein [Chloroflexota bacterium]